MVGFLALVTLVVVCCLRVVVFVVVFVVVDFVVVSLVVGLRLVVSVIFGISLLENSYRNSSSMNGVRLRSLISGAL